jgi:hypothetical protein
MLLGRASERELLRGGVVLVEAVAWPFRVVALE